MNEHTPGPWMDSGRPRHYGSAAVIVKGPVLIAQVQCGENDPEGEANVRLVVEAPNLLAVLRRLVAAGGGPHNMQADAEAVLAKVDTPARKRRRKL